MNTSGVTLTVFELLTVSFETEDFSLREDWEKDIIKNQIRMIGILVITQYLVN